MKINTDGYIAALDVGRRRIGVALAHPVAALPSPYATFTNDDRLWARLEEFIKAEQISTIVLGLPRGLSGQETDQTAETREFAAEIEKRLKLPVYFQDEAVTSLQAEKQLKASGKGYNKETVDAWAATIILEDFLRDNVKEEPSGKI